MSDMMFILASQGTSGPDTEAPTVSAKGKFVSNICQTTFTLNWFAATDNVGVAGYRIYKNGSFFTTSPGLTTSFDITGQTAGATNGWQVLAYDAAGNESSLDATLNVTQSSNLNSILLSSNFASAALACASSINNTKYLSGADTTPINGEIIYNDSCGQTTLNGGGNWYSDGTWGFQVSFSGVISNRTACP